MIKKAYFVWVLWISLTLLAGIALSKTLLSKDRSLFLPQETSHGHYQIELACDSCHGDAFAGEQEMQNACVKCHGDELKQVNDSHPRKKFLDPRNADRLAVLDARLCVTCHVEHRPDMTLEMAVTMPADFCQLCHEDIAKDRPSHKGMKFDTCASVGCHNYHDNKALYEDFLVKHMDDEATVAEGRMLERNLSEYFKKTSPDKKPLLQTDVDYGGLKAGEEVYIDRWLASRHAKGGVNCQSCHKETELYNPEKQREVCKRCHSKEVAGFSSGKHGMKLEQLGLAMTPKEARAATKEKRSHTKMSCSSCHDSHTVNTGLSATVEACMSCHNDQHTTAYKESRHYQLLVNKDSEKSQQGVTCAGCHMQRLSVKENDIPRVLVDHNQNANLRPREKMIRSVCQNCHGIGYSIDALADPKLITNNFSGVPSRHIESIDMARRRDLEKRQRKSSSENAGVKL